MTPSKLILIKLTREEINNKFVIDTNKSLSSVDISHLFVELFVILPSRSTFNVPSESFMYIQLSGGSFEG
jgi:hypothetical protein